MEDAAGNLVDMNDAKKAGIRLAALAATALVAVDGNVTVEGTVTVLVLAGLITATGLVPVDEGTHAVLVLT